MSFEPDRNQGNQLMVPQDQNFGHAGNQLVLHEGNLKQIEDDEIDLRAIWRVLVRYRRLIALIASVFLFTALLFTLLMRPMYTASTTVEINTSGRNLVKFQNLESQDVSSKELILTQAKILESTPIAEEVISRLNLLEEPEFTGKLKQRGVIAGIRSILNLFKGEEIDRDTVMARAVKIYQDRLSVGPVRNSSLIKIYFNSFSPELSALIANEHAKSYIWLTDQRRFNSTSGAKEFLEKEIAVVQAKLETSEKELTGFARKHGVIDVEDRNNIMMVRLGELNQSLASVQNERIDAETKFKQSQTATASELASVYDDPLIKALQEEKATIDAEYNRLSSVYKSKYPAMVQLRDKSSELEISISEQARKIVAGFKNSYEQLLEREGTLELELEKLKGGLLDLQDRAVTYNILKREWEANKELYSGLLERTKEVGVAAGMELNIAAVIDPAKEPSEASSPNLPMNCLLAIFVGVFCGFGAAILLSILDNTVNDVEQLQQLSKLGSLGVTPLIINEELDSIDGIKRETIVHSRPASGFSEAIQSVRTSLEYARAGGFPKSIMVTSSVAGEGKSTIAINLAVSCAKAGKTVLLIEADLRRSRHYKVFNVPSTPGLSDSLVQESAPSKYSIKEVPGLQMIVAGTKTTNPTDLLSSKDMYNLIRSAEEEYDLVIVDAPPVLGLADSLILSKMVQAVLYVVAGHETPKETVGGALQRLRMVNSPLIGTVLNKFDSTTSGYDYYSYDYGQLEEQGKALQS